MSDIELTASEQAQVKNNMDGLTAEVKTLDDAALKGLAKRAGVDAEKFPKREDLETAILNKAHADAIEGVRAIRKMEEEEAAMIETTDEKRSLADRTVRRLHAEFASNIPQDGRAGSFVPSEDDPRFGGDHQVPDGKYRPAGSEHVYEFKRKRLVSVTQATAGNQWGGKGVKIIE